MIPSPETINKVAQWRAKALEGTLTIEETREAIKFLRESRCAALSKPAASKAKTTKTAARSADDLLGELGSL